MMIDPDAELVARVGLDDRAAAELLMHRHLPKMLELARRMLSDPVEAEDAVQDAFMRLWTHAARWQPGQENAYALLNQPDGPFYFAGEHLSQLGAWQEGAVLSARRTINMIDQHRRTKRG
jgi:hypothetical protein